MKRVLICGSNGLLGQRIALALGGRTDLEVLNTGRQRSFVHDHKLFDYTQLDLGSRSDVRSLMSSFQPTTVVNAAGVADVDWCETHREEAWRTNVATVEHVLDGARRVGARIIHISTDYVFDGRNSPYAESALPCPVNYYGKTKLAAENAVHSSGVPAAILRVCLLFGTAMGTANSFATKVVRSLRVGENVNAAPDIGCNPLHVSSAAAAVVSALENDAEGIFHISGADFANRYDFACMLAATFGYSEGLVLSVKTTDLNLPAVRPMSTGFVTSKAERQLGFRPLPLRQTVSMFKQEFFHLAVN